MNKLPAVPKDFQARLHGNPDLPYHAMLQSPDPIQTPPGMQESLTSWLQRLIQMHEITPKPFATGFYREMVNKHFSEFFPGAPKKPDIFGKSSRKLAGANNTGEAARHIFYWMTFNPEVLRMSLFELDGILAVSRSLRKSNLYCPLCNTENPIPYIPILFHLSEVTACPVHGIKLLEECPKCEHPFIRITTDTPFDKCPQCQGALNNTTCQIQTAEESEIAIAQLVAEIINNKDRGLYRPSNLRWNLKRIVQVVGSRTELAALLGVHHQSASAWVKHQEGLVHSKPTLKSLLNVALKTGVSGHDLLSRRLSREDIRVKSKTFLFAHTKPQNEPIEAVLKKLPQMIDEFLAQEWKESASFTKFAKFAKADHGLLKNGILADPKLSAQLQRLEKGIEEINKEQTRSREQKNRKKIKDALLIMKLKGIELTLCNLIDHQLENYTKLPQYNSALINSIAQEIEQEEKLPASKA